jgi:hypothetical protein
MINNSIPLRGGSFFVPQEEPSLAPRIQQGRDVPLAGEMPRQTRSIRSLGMRPGHRLTCFTSPGHDQRFNIIQQVPFLWNMEVHRGKKIEKFVLQLNPAFLWNQHYSAPTWFKVSLVTANTLNQGAEFSLFQVSIKKFAHNQLLFTVPSITLF